MELNAKKFLKAIKKYKKLLIYVKGSPDPDALASGFAIHALCESMSIQAHMITEMHLSLEQNIEFVKILDIPLRFKSNHFSYDSFDGYIVTDHQSKIVPDISETVPCVAHIDHHEIIDEEISAEYELRNVESGSTSTLIALILKELEVDFTDSQMESVCTALMYGIKTDTDKYDHATHLDYEAMNYLSQYVNKDIINKLSGMPLGKKTIQLLARAIENEIIYKDWLIAGVGFVEELQRDSIAIIADLLLKRQDVSTAVVFGAIVSKENNSIIVDASFRSIKENLNLNDIIKKITDHGGARKYKGAYQINLDYLYHCPDKELLWNVINVTTIEVLKKRRDGIYIMEIEGLFKKLKKRIGNLFD